jgi:hypothetical protein
LNLGGNGAWHDSFEAALSAAQRAIDGGRRNIDLGCFQINHHWHRAEFATLGEMLEPVTNARYAARFLQDLHNEFGDWDGAIAAFHSRNPLYANRYLARYRAIMAEQDGPQDWPTPSHDASFGPSGPMLGRLRPSHPLFAPGREVFLRPARPMSAASIRPLLGSR